ncbi:MAG TPA: porin PorA family protein [Actinomycetota bacterium]|nr:porin PorA family protein [Actinomycetota bacterium]
MPNIVRRLLITLGVAAFLGGPLYGLALAPRWDVVPSDLPRQQVAAGRGVYLAPTRGYRVIGPVGLRNIHRVALESEAAALVLVARDRTDDLDHRREVDHSTTTYALDPHTARSVMCCGAETDRQGALAQAFPPRTKAESYPWWDGTAQRVVMARFAGEAMLDGRHVYRFDVRVPPIAIDRVAVPRAAVGSDVDGQVALDWWYTSTTRLLVEPASGVIVRGTQSADQWLADGSGTRRLTVATTSFTDTPATVRANLAVADRARSLQQARRTWPLVVGPLLAVALLACVAVRWDQVPAEQQPAPAVATPIPRRRASAPAPRGVSAWQPAGPNDLQERRPA